MILLFLFLAFLIRLINLNQSLWLDEAINVLAAKNLGFWHFVSGYPMGDFHPPGFFAVLWVWTRIFGFSEIAVRLPSVLLGTATVFVTYLIGVKLFNRKVAVLAGVLIGVAPLHIYYSQEVRMYALAAFAATLSYYFLITFPIHRKIYLPFIISTSLVLYSDYLVYLVIPAQILYVVIFQKRDFGKIIFNQLIALSLLSPWLLVFPKQLIEGVQASRFVPGWGEVVGGASLKNVSLIFAKIFFGRISFDNKIIYGSLFGLCAVFVTIINSLNILRWKKPQYLLLSWIIVPIVLAYTISFKVPVLSFFRMLFILPAFYLLLADSILSLKFLTIKKIAIVLFLSLSLFSLVMFNLTPRFQRENWRDLNTFLTEIHNENSIVLFENSGLPAPFIYYYKNDYPAYGAIKNFPVRSVKDLIDLEGLTKEASSIFLVEYLVDIADPNKLLASELENLGFMKVATFDKASIGFIYEYQRKN